MTKKGPWTVKTTEIKYKNPWIEVREDKVIRPDGKDGICGVVCMKSGVSVLPYDADGNVYLTEEYHYGVERITTEVVSGGIDANETLLDAAKRELWEETGLSANEWIDLGSIDPFTTVVVCPNHLYLARGLSQGISSQEGTETIQLKRVPFSQALDMAMTGKITHGASVAVILKTALFLEKEGK
jgi:ADP-ribose pyrophosphatase